MAIGTRYIGIGEESTYGTAASVSKYIKDAVSEEFAPDVENVLIDGMSYMAHADYMGGKKQVKGGFSFPVASENGIGQLLKWTLGSASTSGSDPLYTHTISEAKTVKSFTTKIDRDGTEYVYTGCLIDSLKLATEISKPLLATASVIGKAETTGTEATPTYTTTRYLSWKDASLSIESTDKSTSVSAVTIEIKPKYAVDKAFALGSQEMVAQPVLHGIREVTGTIDFREGDSSVRSAFLASTSNSLELTFTGDSSHELKLTLPEIIYDSYKDSIKGTDLTSVSVPFKAIYDTTAAYSIQATLKNSESTL